MGKKRKGYGVVREVWTTDWRALGTPLGLPGQRQGVCTRTSFVPLREELPPKAPEYRFYAVSLPPARADQDRIQSFIRGHWGVENRLHHPKDRTWLEDRHWVGNAHTGSVVTMLRSLACGLIRLARFSNLPPEAYCPERIEFLNSRPRCAVKLVTGKVRL